MILTLFLVWPAPAAAASIEDTLARATGAMLAPGEGQVTEAIYAAEGGAARETELPLVARARYTYKAPRARVEVTEIRTKRRWLIVHDGKEAWLITQIGGTRLSQVAPALYRALSERAFPIGLPISGARLGGIETIAGRLAQVIEGTGPDGGWTLWVDVVDGRVHRYRLRGGEQIGDLTYGSGGFLRKITVRNWHGRLVLVRFRDPPAKMAVDEATFSFEQARVGPDLSEALARSLAPGRTQGPVVTATAGARGVDEEIQRRQLGRMRLDYQALVEIERFRLNEADVENFLRAGKLGRYRE